ncbi:MAG: YjbF family lipoprotein [Luteimonas sp.]
MSGTRAISWTRAAAWSLLIVGLLAITGCTGLPRGSLDAARLAITGSSVDATAEQVAASPFAQILVDGPDGEALMVLGNDDAGLTSWYSPDRRIVFLRNGVLAGTSGLTADAVDIRIVGDNPFERLASITSATTVRRYDWMPGYRYGVELRGRLQRGNLESVEILGTTRRLQRFDESLEGAGTRASNRYWADPATGAIVRSREFVAPGVTLEITVLKPYVAGPAR